MQADAIAKEKEAAMLIAQEARAAEAKKRHEAEEAEVKIKQEIAAAEASGSGGAFAHPCSVLCCCVTLAEEAPREAARCA